MKFNSINQSISNFKMKKLLVIITISDYSKILKKGIWPIMIHDDSMKVGMQELDCFDSSTEVECSPGLPIDIS